MKTCFAFLIIGAVFVGAAGCGSNTAETPAKKPVIANPNGLTDFEMEHGVGPIKQKITLSETIDKTLATKGEKIFEVKCYQCHRIDSKLVGPPLFDVAARRKPEYILNMILNPEGMLQKHPEPKKLLAQYLTPMTFQNVTKDEALAILEYLRKMNQEHKKPS